MSDIESQPEGTTSSVPETVTQTTDQQPLNPPTPTPTPTPDQVATPVPTPDTTGTPTNPQDHDQPAVNSILLPEGVTVTEEDEESRANNTPRAKDTFIPSPHYQYTHESTVDPYEDKPKQPAPAPNPNPTPVPNPALPEDDMDDLLDGALDEFIKSNPHPITTPTVQPLENESSFELPEIEAEDEDDHILDSVFKEFHSEVREKPSTPAPTPVQTQTPTPVARAHQPEPKHKEPKHKKPKTKKPGTSLWQVPKPFYYGLAGLAICGGAGALYLFFTKDKN